MGLVDAAPSCRQNTHGRLRPGGKQAGALKGQQTTGAAVCRGGERIRRAAATPHRIARLASLSDTGHTSSIVRIFAASASISLAIVNPPVPCFDCIFFIKFICGFCQTLNAPATPQSPTRQPNSFFPAERARFQVSHCHSLRPSWRRSWGSSLAFHYCLPCKALLHNTHNKVFPMSTSTAHASPEQRRLRAQLRPH